MPESFKDDIRHPNYRGPNPFADEEDVADADVVDDAGIFTSSSSGEQMAQYEVSAPDRAGITLPLAITGTITALSCLTPIAQGWGIAPFSLAAFVLSFAALLVARSDLAGMRVGAIAKDRKASTKFALGVGLFGTLFSLAMLAYSIFF